MPLKRTPPSTSQYVSSPMTTSPRAGSEPNLTNVFDTHDDDNLNITQRFLKRKRQCDCDFDCLEVNLEKMFDSKMSIVLKSINELKTQNSVVSDSIEFVTKQYDTIMLELQSLREERRENIKYIQQLETKIENLERKFKSSSLEIKNIPKTGPETKEDLVNIVIKTGNLLSVPVQPGDVRDIFRINTKNESNKPIVVELNSVLLRDKFLHNIKDYNIKNSSNKFTTKHLKYSGEGKQIYISESLTLKTRKLFFSAREFAKVNEYDFCWVNHGVVYMRKTNGSRYIRIENEEDLKNLKK